MKKSIILALAVVFTALTSCKKATPDIPTEIPDSLFSTYWVGTTTTAKWEMIFPSDSGTDKLCYIITTMYSTGKEKMSRYSFMYMKPILKLTPYPESEELPGFSGTVSLSSQGLALTLDGSEAGFPNPIVLFYTKPDSLEGTRAGLLQ